MRAPNDDWIANNHSFSQVFSIIAWNQHYSTGNLTTDYTDGTDRRERRATSIRAISVIRGQMVCPSVLVHAMMLKTHFRWHFRTANRYTNLVPRNHSYLMVQA